MRVILATLAATLGLCAQPAAAQASTTDYANPANWLCLPGRNDICSMPLSVTPLGPKGYGAQQVQGATPTAPIDCFYVYPTISRDSGMNSDLTPSSSEEKFVAQYQFARLSSVCRPFAPMYRQITMSAIAVGAAGGDVSGPGAIAYGDVLAAWRDFINNRNEGRPFVLIGHSQGSIMLEELLAKEIEGSPAHARMLRAILPGWNIRVPQGKLVGGSFRLTPLCSRDNQTGCVVSWVTFGEGKPPQSNATFGSISVPGQTVACVNPAKPGSRGWERLDGFWFARSSYPVPGGKVRWSSTGAPPTAYITTPDLLEGRCVNRGGMGYLEIRSAAAAGDVRTRRVGGEVGQFGFFLAGWGKHLADISIAQDDLIASIGALSSRTPQSNISSND